VIKTVPRVVLLAQHSTDGHCKLAQRQQLARLKLPSMIGEYKIIEIGARTLGAVRMRAEEPDLMDAEIGAYQWGKICCTGRVPPMRTNAILCTGSPRFIKEGSTNFFQC
jgi:hypothetical protein